MKPPSGGNAGDDGEVPPCKPWNSPGRTGAVIAVLREKAVPYMLEHANVIEEHLKRHGPGELTVRLSLTYDVVPSSGT